MAFLKSYRENAAGNIGILAALAMVIILGGAGSAVDYMRFYDKRTSFDAAADAAVLAAVAVAAENPTLNLKAVQAKAKEIALKAWKSNLDAENYALIKNPDVDMEKVGLEWKATVTYDQPLNPLFLSLVGVKNMPLHGVAVASSGGTESRHWEFHIAIDTSSSMGIGATQADMNNMIADPKIGCAFACHWSPTGSKKPDSVALSAAAGYKLRIDVVDAAVDSMIDEISKIKGLTPKAALYGIANTTTTLVAKTAALKNVSGHKTELALTTVSEGNTNYRQALQVLTGNVGVSYDGKSASKPRKVAFIITDGIHDTKVMEPNVVKTVGPLHRMGTVDPNFCQTMKSAGVLVGVLYIDYIVPTGFEGYVSSYQKTVLPSLKACASENMFYNATSPAGITSAMSNMLAEALMGEVRLSQ